MANSSLSSALVTDQGRKVLLRIRGRQYELDHMELRTLLGLPPGRPGVGITVDRDCFRFEFASDDRTIELSADQLRRRLGKQFVAAPR